MLKIIAVGLIADYLATRDGNFYKFLNLLVFLKFLKKFH